MSATGPAVLLSWIATNNDPYERERSTRVLRDGQPVPGPSLTLLADPASPYCGRITDAVFLRQGGADAERHARIYDELVTALRERAPGLRPQSRVFVHDDPTDHGAIFEFLRREVLQIRRTFRGRELIVHVSPGTPAMQTVWVLMAETGFIEPPVTVVQSYRERDRRGRPLVVPVTLGIDTFYKRYSESRPVGPATAEGSVGWKPQFRSPKMVAVHREAQRLAPLKVPILILGERGTGKTQLAGWIRQWSRWCRPERNQDWAEIACGQYSAETMRAELFGYLKGAFTDAKTDRTGLLKHADGDTLFLDEIGDIPRELQRLLIKAIEQKRFQPIGASKFETTDFRLLSATNLPLRDLRARLDADFLDRISPFVLHLPPLRDALEDLEWLWDEVLGEAARRAEVDPRWTRLPDVHRRRLVRALQAHELPGNLRDLFRVAWRFLAARSDSTEPMTVDQAVTDALTVLDPAADVGSDVVRAFTRAFTDGQPLPDSLFADGPVDPTAVWKEQQRWFAREVARISRERSVAAESLTPVNERTLRTWRKK